MTTIMTRRGSKTKGKIDWGSVEIGQNRTALAQIPGKKYNSRRNSATRERLRFALSSQG